MLAIPDDVATRPTPGAYVIYAPQIIETREKDIWEEIGEDMVDVARFIGPPLIRGAKYLGSYWVPGW
jgi:hypothetical protein